MSKKSDTKKAFKTLTIGIKDLSFRHDQYVLDLIRFIAEALPQTRVARNGNSIEIEAPESLSKRVIKLRIKKFLYKKGLDGEYRPISLNNTDLKGYVIKEKKIVELDYY